MWKIKRLMFLLLLLTMASCATQTSPFSTKEENAWFIFQDMDFGGSFPVYCMANKKDATAEPVCFKSKNVGFERPQNKFSGKRSEED